MLGRKFFPFIVELLWPRRKLNLKIIWALCVCRKLDNILDKRPEQLFLSGKTTSITSWNWPNMDTVFSRKMSFCDKLYEFTFLVGAGRLLLVFLGICYDVTEFFELLGFSLHIYEIFQNSFNCFPTKSIEVYYGLKVRNYQ